MKKYIFKSFAVAAAATLLFATTGCKKLQEFGDTDVNPMGSVNPINSALLADAQMQLGTFVNGSIANSVRGALFAQQISETQYTDASLYADPKIEFSGTYAGPLMNLQVIINRNSDPTTAAANAIYGSNANQIAVAKILQSYYFWTITDRWGDVPYSEALQGAANKTPKYDKQQDIYTGLDNTLKAAVASFDGGLAVKGDQIYGGDQAKWKKLANTMRMMIALRMVKADEPTARARFIDAYNDPAGYIDNNSDNMVVSYPGDGTYNHPWFTIYDGRNDYSPSKTFGDMLSGLSDGRRAQFATSGAWFPYGLKREDAVATTSWAKVLPDGFRQIAGDWVIINAASSLLAVAEGRERTWVSGDAKAAYDAGVTASFDQWNASGAAAYLAAKGNYLTGTGAGSGLGDNSYGSVSGQSAVTASPLDRIYLQRYIAHYPDGLQAWSEWRRSCAIGTPNPATAKAGMPSLMPTTYGTNSGAGIPRRYVYGTSEYSTNPSSVGAAVAALPGGDKPSSRVWWDK